MMTRLCNWLLLWTCLLSGGLNSLCSAQQNGMFKAYEVNFSIQPGPVVNTNGLTRATQQFTAVKNAQGTLLTIPEAGVWRGYWPIGQLGQLAGYETIIGGEKLTVSYTFSPGSRGSAGATLSVQYLNGPTIDIATGNSIIPDGKPHTAEFTLPQDAAGKHISALWLRIDNARPGPTRFTIKNFSWYRREINTSINADAILSKPPNHNVRVRMHNGAMTILIDDQPITGLGWGDIILPQVGDPELRDMVASTDFKLARIIFTLGEQIPLELYPPTWLGPKQYDFSYLDQQLIRVFTANPKTKLILQVALDGARWWVMMHNEAMGATATGVPDYLSAEWQHDSREAIRQLVAHVRTTPYADDVIGYQLMNGGTEDCNFEVNVVTPPAVRRFHAFLHTKYSSDAALQNAWHDRNVTLENATANITPAERQQAFLVNGAFPLLYEFYRSPAMEDKIEFHNHEYQQIILNFAHDIKEATHGRVIVGARTGDFMGNIYNWPDPLSWQQSPIDELIESPDFDYFEVQEPYIGRGLGDYSSGIPVTLPQGLAAHNKLIIIQNDVRTHLSAPNAGYGRTADLPSTITMQRRVFVNSLVLGMAPYLWQQEYHYNDPQMLADFRRQQAIYQRALSTDRSSGAEVAMVFDVNYRKYFGYDPVHTAPSQGVALFDYVKWNWPRSGVPFDMIFLDQLFEEKTKPYKVYVFVQTVGLTAAQREKIEHVVRQKGRVAIFMWADGLIDGQKIDVKKMSDLIGMQIKMSAHPSDWLMSPTKELEAKSRATASSPMGALRVYEPSDPNGAHSAYAPSFAVDDPKAESFALYAERNAPGTVGVALKRNGDWTSIYSASPIIAPELLTFAAHLAGIHVYTDAQDDSYINRSFIGFHARDTHTIRLQLPANSALYEVFSNQELPVNNTFDIPVVKNQTYLFFRGDRKTWQHSN